MQSTTKTEAGSRERCEIPSFRIIFNWDGAPLGYLEYPQSVDRLMDKIYEPIRDTQVGAMFWHIGGHEAAWPSEALEQAGDSADRLYDSVRGMRHGEGVRAMFERGENPYQAMVRRGHELGIQVFASIRMNDNHFYGIRPQDMAKSRKGGLTQLRKDHPEWCLDVDQVPEQRGVGSWNMAVPEVREHRLQYITEACRQADWDGVELDWQRHAFHLPENDGYRLRYTLTDLQRAVRRMADQIAEERGRPFYVAVRVATTLESCRRIGYDVEAWVNEGLCDMVTAAGCSATDAGVEVEAFTNLTNGAGVRFYGGLDSLYRQQAQRLAPDLVWRDAWLRATATGYLDRGADGMYVFNWFPGKGDWTSLLATMGSRETMKGKDKIYAAVRRGPTYLDGAKQGSVNDRIYGETSVVLFRTLTRDGPRFSVPVHDEVVEESKAGNLESVELQIEIEHYSTRDEVEVTLDGVSLGTPTVRNVAAEDPSVPSDVSENSWLVWSLAPSQADKGPHEIQVVLVSRDPRIRVPMVINHVEIYVNYKS